MLQGELKVFEEIKDELASLRDEIQVITKGEGKHHQNAVAAALKAHQMFLDVDDLVFQAYEPDNFMRLFRTKTLEFFSVS